MPGIRTIRADNILIIESREATARPPKGAPETPPAARPPPARGPAPRPLSARGGAAVTEVRAAEVVVYEPAPPRSPSGPGPVAPAQSEPGRVSRLLQKFDQRPPGAHPPRAKWRGGGDVPRPEPAVPNACGAAEEEEPVVAPAPLSPAAAHPGSWRSLQPGPKHFVQKIGSNSFVVNPRGHRPPSPAASAPAAARPALSNGPTGPEEEGAGLPALLPAEPGPQAAAPVLQPVPCATAAPSPTHANSWKPKPEGAVEAAPSSASPESGAATGSARPTPRLLNSSCSFEIYSAPLPDLAAIPAHDLQAQALASLRLNSRNSFLFVPRQRRDAPEPAETPSPLPGGALPAGPEKPLEALVPVTYIDEDLGELEGFDVPQESPLSPDMEDSAVPTYRPHLAGFATFSQKDSNTFTVVPKQKPPRNGLETFSRASLQEEEEEEEEEESFLKARNDVPRKDPAQLLKKRYPTVNEIEVIGGYLSLDKSCMSKSDSRRKKMKISFNETSLQTMFEYPSESSLVEEEEEEEEEEEDEYATEVDETPALFTPLSSSTVHSTNSGEPAGPLGLLRGPSGLSSYTPKHSGEVSLWHEQQYQELPTSTGAFPQNADLPGNQVMV
uniref:Taperin n=1 Tax=Varanus komodoensis TaxID=61221 RepID=A0A8D2IS32_VARKO